MAKEAVSRFPFTIARLREIKPPEKGRVYHYDSKVAGLCLLVTSRGTKVFYWYRWANGKPTRLRIGPFPATPLEVARNAAEAFLGKAAMGENPAAERAAQRAAPTVDELFAWYMEHHAKPFKSTAWMDEQQYHRCVKVTWGHRKAETIGRRDAAKLHTETATERGPVAANRLRAMLRKMFAVGIDHALVDPPNPIDGVKRFRERSRDRYLNAEELGRFFAALLSDDCDWARDIILLLLLTAARKSAVLTMAWQDIDLPAATWRIPPTRSKSGEPLLIPLGAEAVAVLKARQGRHPRWVFPGRWDGPIASIAVAWKRILAKAELSDVRLHDLRRTTASWQAMLGVPLQTIGRTLGHKSISATEVYARLGMDPAREALERATTAMLAAAGVKLIGGPEDEG